MMGAYVLMPSCWAVALNTACASARSRCLGALAMACQRGEIWLLHGSCQVPQHHHALGVPVLSWSFLGSYRATGVFGLMMSALVVDKLLHDSQDLRRW